MRMRRECVDVRQGGEWGVPHRERKHQSRAASCVHRAGARVVGDVINDGYIVPAAVLPEKLPYVRSAQKANLRSILAVYRVARWQGRLHRSGTGLVTIALDIFTVVDR